MTDKQNWLAEYAKTGSDAAFRELVTCYVDLVYSTALRLVGGDAHRAKDVAQTVFINLARVARTLPKDVKLGGWLHRDTCFTASTLMRGERRRQSRERQAAEMNALQNTSQMDYSLVAPVLDEAINELDETDRTAILLRFFEQNNFRSVGDALGSNEDAARMRVTRALEKLEAFLKRRGITTTAASLGVVLSANAVQAAPVGLALTISTAAALTGTTLATTATVTATKAIAMTAFQKTIVTTTIAVLAGAGIYEARQASQLREQVQTLQQQLAPLAEQVQQLQHDYNDATNRFTAMRDEKERATPNTAELLKLRDEIGRLKSNVRNSAQIEEDDIQTQWAAWLHTVRTNGLIGLADVPYLVQALTNQATPIRVEATKALRQIGLERLLNTNLTAQANLELELAAKVATPRLLEALNDSDAFVRANAAITLGFLRENSQTVVPALINLLSDEQVRVAGSAAKALGRFQNDASSAIPELLQLAKSPNEDLRETAIAAIKQIDPKAAKTAGFD